MPKCSEGELGRNIYTDPSASRVIETPTTDDDDPYVQKATGGLLREAGKKDVGQLRSFLGDHAGMMAPTTLRYAMEHLTPAEHERYRRKRVTR